MDGSGKLAEMTGPGAKESVHGANVRWHIDVPLIERFIGLAVASAARPRKVNTAESIVQRRKPTPVRKDVQVGSLTFYRFEGSRFIPIA